MTRLNITPHPGRLPVGAAFNSDDLVAPDPRETRLPAWAQKTLQLLRMRLKEERAAHVIAAAKTPRSRILVDPYRKHDAGAPPHYLPDRSTIRWQMSTLPRHVKAEIGGIDVRLIADDGAGPARLQIAADNLGMLVRPVISNVIEVLLSNDSGRIGAIR